jgi:hypothetical protein
MAVALAIASSKVTAKCLVGYGKPTVCYYQAIDLRLCTPTLFSVRRNNMFLTLEKYLSS